MHVNNNSTLLIRHDQGQYPIFIGDYIANLPVFIKGTQALIITDENVAPYYLSYIQKQISPTYCDVLVLPPGEQHKTLQTFQMIIDYCASHFYHRDATLIALGGGVISDLTGFAAACYHRGIAWIAIPTTLLAQVDASVGGKTAVNHVMGKNLIGALYPPTAVFIDIQTLKTLPDREYRASMSEIIKAALIIDAVFFDWLEKNLSKLLVRDTQTLLYAIQRSIEIKRDIVMQDEKEKNHRMLLNFGHTFAHAIEKLCGYGNILHGEAVAHGIGLASHLSYQLGCLTTADLNRVASVLIQHRLVQPLPQPITSQDLLQVMQSDKKIQTNQLRLVILKKIGQAGVITAEKDASMIYDLLQSYCYGECKCPEGVSYDSRNI